MAFKIIAVVEILAVMALYLLWTARRLDRLHARVDAAASALEAQLVRRQRLAVELSATAAITTSDAVGLRLAAEQASHVRGLGSDREAAENAVAHALARAVAGPAATVPPDALRASSSDALRASSSDALRAGSSDALRAMYDGALRATFARRFYNDTVRDALVIRDRRIVRWLRLAGRAPHPEFFEIDDQELSVSPMSLASGPRITV